MSKRWPKISIVIPTLNAESVFGPCLESIAMQDYPKEQVEIVIADGGSTDGTVEFAKKYNAKVTHNKLKTGEAGKLAGLKIASGEFVALIDSDNILPSEDWLKQMISPLLKHSEAVGSEPWKYTWRQEDSFITRYSALIGMNDPLVHFLGNYDRYNLLTGTWTEVPREEEDHEEYILIKFTDSKSLPTIGANGAVFRTAFLKENVEGDYLFDIDLLVRYVENNGFVHFIKVKNGIIHTFCEGNIFKFAKKQRRRVKDFLYHKWAKKDRAYDWYSRDILGDNPGGTIKFIVSCVTVFPLFYHAIKGYIKKRDIAWFFHPLACEITLWEYGWGRIFSLFKKSEISRDNWSQ